MDTSLPRRCLAEFLGTFCLLFLGTGAVAVDAAHPDKIGHFGIALSFGLVVLMMIYAIGSVSGAHINPAVSIAFASVGRFPWKEVPVYALVQFAGAIAGSFAVLKCFGSGGDLGATSFTSTSVAIPVEFLLTAILMFVIMGVSTGAKQENITGAIAVGSTIALHALVGGPVTGASMNPARSLGPALVGNNLSQILIYLVVPCFGAVAGAFAFGFLKESSGAATSEDEGDSAE